MIDERGKCDAQRLNTTDVIIEIDEHDLPRYVACWARWYEHGGESILRAVTADAGKFTLDDSWTIFTRDRLAVQMAVDAAVTDIPVVSGAWTAIETAIERYRESTASSTRELFAQLRGEQ